MEVAKRNEIYPNKKKEFAQQQEKLEQDTYLCFRANRLSFRNKELIENYQSHLFAKDSSEARVTKVTQQLRRICRVLKKDLDQVVKADIEKLVAFINRFLKKKNGQDAADATKSDYRRSLKQFYYWFRDEDKRFFSDCKEELHNVNALYRYIQSVKRSYKDPKRDPSQVLDDKDIQTVISKGCKSLREQALIKLLHETGIRVGELLNIRLKDITVNEKCIEIQVDGKTGPRPVYCVSGMSYLVKYLELHPDKDNPESFLWLSHSNSNKGDALKHKGCQKLIDRCFKRSGITKRHNLHWFRHSRASIWGEQFTEEVLNKLMGWVPGSRMAKTYVHIGKKEARRKLLSSQGILEKGQEPEKKPQFCSCGGVNDYGSKYCYKCGKPLRVDVLINDRKDYENELDKTIKFMLDIMKDPAMMEKLNEFKTRRENGK